MKSRIINLLLVITSLLGYLQWSGNNQAFLFEAEVEILYKIFTDPVAVLHLFTILPLVSQIFLVITLFQRTPNKTLTYIGMAGLVMLLGFMFVIGIISGNYKILLSTIPFLTVIVVAIRHYGKTKMQF